MTSLRPETVACIAVGSLLHLDTTAEKIDFAIVPYYTDSLSVVQHASILHWHAAKRIFENDMDVILENHRLLRKLKVKLVPTHVLVYHDRVKQEHELTAVERLNIRMDTLVSEFLSGPPDDLVPQEEALFFPSQQVCLQCDGITITSELQE